MKFVLLGFGVIFLLILALGAYVFWNACARRKELPWLVEEEIKRTSYAKYYDCMKDAEQWLQDHNQKDVYITSDDGLKLRARWIENKNPVGTILFAHGYRSTPLLDFGVAYPFYYEMGFNILIPDQRSHGKSQGRFITFGVKECKDFLCWINYHNEQLGKYPILLSGLSMGASTVMYLADEDLPKNVGGIIADCGFTSPKDILGCVFKSVTHLPAGIAIWATNLFARLIAGFSLNQKDSRKSLSKNKLPILMVHGKDDDFVPCWMTEEGYAVCAGDKQLLLVDGAGHGVSFLEDPEAYTALLHKMIEKVLAKNN